MDPRPEAPTQPKTSRAPLVAALIAVLVAVGGVVAWRALVLPQGVVEPAAPVVVAPRPIEDAGPTLSLEDGDALVKQLAKGWSVDEQFLSWLDGPTVRYLTGAVQQVAEGQSPVHALPFLHLAGAYDVREEESAKPVGKQPRPPPRVFVSPATWARYDAVTHTFTSVNAAAAGEAWSKLRPFFDTAFAEVGKPGQRFDDVLTAAIKRLVSVQFPEGEVELLPKGAIYVYADPVLENLSPAEKQLLRLGPVNGRAVQATLRSFAAHAHLELGR